MSLQTMTDAELQSLALKLKNLYAEISPLIENFTARHCPECTSVCCMDRHGTHEAHDMLYLRALRENIDEFLIPAKDSDTLSCRYIGEMGCELKRWQRPHRCTWYFCERLLEVMPRENPRMNRKLVQCLREVQEVWAKISKIPQ